MNLGKVFGESPQHIIIRAQEWNADSILPEIGDPVYTNEKERIGIIADIFGPVTKPFIAVSPDRSPLPDKTPISALKGTSVYTLPAKKAHIRPKPMGKRSTRPISSKKYRKPPTQSKDLKSHGEK